MSSATNAFQDLGHFCVGNLPITMIQLLACLVTSESVRRREFVVQRGLLIFAKVDFWQTLKNNSPCYENRSESQACFFFEISHGRVTTGLVKTRRRHPAEGGRGLPSSIGKERAAMAKIRSLAIE